MSNCILAELLYIISNFEKSRCRVKTIWTKKYVYSLKQGLSIMRKIIGIIKNDEVIKFEELNLILAYVSKNIDLTLARQISENISHTISEDVVYQLNNKSIEQIKVIYLIDNILTECYKLLSRPRGKNKIKIAYSLMALHNLPRALFEDATRFLIDIPPLTTHEAICTAQSYLSICSNGL